MRRGILLLALLAAGNGRVEPILLAVRPQIAQLVFNEKKPLCAVVAAPRLILAPLRYLRARVTVERHEEWRRAELFLLDEDGFEVRRSQVWEQTWNQAPRTTTVEWARLTLGSGVYRVTLVVTTAVEGQGCTAADRVTVVDVDGEP